MVAVILVALSWFGFPRSEPTSPPAPQSSIFKDADGAVAKFTTPVSLLELPSGLIAIANYQNVFTFDRGTGELSLLDIDLAGKTSRYVPTGLAVDRKTGHVFIANYTDDSILETSLDGKRLTVIDRIASPGSPENVTLSDELMASANYDSGTVHVYRRSEGFVPTCKVDIANAHGIAFAHGFLFATGLGARKLYKIDPGDCRIIASIGKKGWEPDQFLWPTSVFDLGSGIMVSDAHTGRISIYDYDLNLTRRFGGNGPGSTGLNMPYGAIASRGSIWVTSTFGDRLVRFDENGTPIETWDVAGHAWHQAFSESQFMIGDGFNGYRSPQTVQIRGSCHRPNYGYVEPCYYFNGDDIRLPGSYFVQAIRTSAGSYLVSPQYDEAMYFSDDGSEPVKTNIGFDNWVVDGKLISARGPIELPNVR